MPSESELVYGESTAWKPERPRFTVFGLLVSWLATGVALMVAAGLLPGVYIDGFWGALLVAAIAAALNAVIPPVLAALRLPLTLVLGFVLVLLADAAILLLADALTDGVLRVDGFGWALLAALVVAAVSVGLAVLVGSDDTYSLRVAQRIARRQGIIARTDVPGDRLPGDRWARAAGAAAGDARRQRPDHGPLAGRGHARSGRVGDRSVLADGGQPGGDPAGIQRGHPRLPLGREGDRDADDVLGAAGLRGDRAAARDRHRPADRRRLEPRQPALRRGGGRDPHRQPDGRGEEVQSGLSGVPGQRRQRDAHARALRIRGHPRVDRRPSCHPPRRAAARPPRRHLPVDARRAVRLRARPDRLGRAHRHDARAARRLRDVLELRRGRAPLGPRARRHARGPAQARRPLRADRPCPPLRPAALRDRRPLRPRPDAGRDVQAAQRLRPRRARRALPRTRRGLRDRRRRRAELDGRPRRQRGHGQEGQDGPRTTSPTATSSCSARATSASST